MMMIVGQLKLAAVLYGEPFAGAFEKKNSQKECRTVCRSTASRLTWQVMRQEAVNFRVVTSVSGGSPGPCPRSASKQRQFHS